MQQIVNITDVRNNISQLVKEVAKENKTIVIIRDSKPEAALVSYEKARTLTEQEDREWKKRFDTVMMAIRKQGRAYLKKRGIDWKKMTEEEFYDFVDTI